MAPPPDDTGQARHDADSGNAGTENGSAAITALPFLFCQPCAGVCACATGIAGQAAARSAATRSGIGGWLISRRAMPPSPEMPNAWIAFGNVFSP